MNEPQAGTRKGTGLSLTLYNTLTRKKAPFEPLDKNNVRMYVCGPTVYDYAHIGNARPVIVFDVLYRLLRHTYGEDHVTYVRNITDVDDKINARAAEEGVEISEITKKTTDQFHADVAALGCLEPNIEPRATDHIDEMIAMIKTLIEKDVAYEAEGHVLFQVSKMADYGKLSGRSVDDMIAGARVEVAPYKKDPMDFVLWKPSEENLPGWDSPWGRGRPGWHIECSAMSNEHLNTPFDIHGGGIDLTFPHHENEVAQSRCCFGTDTMAQVWMHNGYLEVEGEKMSKSLGNFITIRQLLDEWKGYGWPGEALRYNMLKTHYRRPLDWTSEALDESHKTLWEWAEHLEGVISTEIPKVVIDALSDDLNTPKVISELHALYKAKDFGALQASLNFLGFSGDRENLGRIVSGTFEAHGSSQVKAVGAYKVLDIEGEELEKLIAARITARDNKDWAEADRIRDELEGMGIQLMDAKDPDTGEITTTWEVKR